MTGKHLTRRSMLKLAGLSLFGAAVAACGGTPAPTATPAKPAAEPTKPVAAATPAPSGKMVTLKLMCWGGDANAVARDVALRQAYPDLNSTSKTEVIVGGPGDFDVAQKLRLALAAGDKNNIPDMVQFNKTQVPEFAISGELLDLGPSYDTYGKDLYDGALALVKYAGKYVCFPFELRAYPNLAFVDRR